MPPPGSPTAARPTQSFPLSPVKLLSPPRLKFYDDIDSLPDVDSDSEDDQLAKLMAKTKPSQSLAGAPSTVSASQSPVTSPEKKKISASQQVSVAIASSGHPSIFPGKKRKVGSESTGKSTEPVAKRPKSKLANPHKHEDYYHLDGNVIIEIDKTRFKLHRSRLLHQSDYFGDLFEHNDNISETVDDQPLYTISGVTVKDFEVLLGAMDHAM